MGFEHYRVILKLLSPLHIGKRKYRNLMETREYVPGRTLWGALTARIVRDYFDGESKKYEKIGKFLNENFRFGYFWPAVESDVSQSEFRKFKIYFPWESEKKADKEKHGKLEFIYEFVKPEYFDYLLKSGYMGQPIDYTRGATEEGQLHEAEFIAPKTRDGRQVYLMGDLWVSDKNGFIESKDPLKVKIEGKTINLAEVFNSIQIGGERNYGWGRVKCEGLKLHNGDALGGIKVDGTDADVTLEFPENSRLTAHALAAEWDDSKPVSKGVIKGEVEPLSGYFWGEKDWALHSPPICYIPGSKLIKAQELKIVKFGILSQNKISNFLAKNTAKR